MESMEERAQKAIAEIMRPHPENSIHYLMQQAGGSSTYHHIFTNQDLIVVEVRGPFPQKAYEEKWIGQHIKKVRDDVQNKLVHSSIHRADWTELEDVQKLLSQYRMQERYYNATKNTYNKLLQKQRLDELERAALQNAPKEMEAYAKNVNELSLKLDRVRATHFGDDPENPPRYFTHISLEDSK